MRLVTPDDVEREGLFGTPPEHFPFTFLPNYSRFVHAMRNGKVAYVQHHDLVATAPLALFENRLLRLGQWLSPPMRSGRALSVEEERVFLLASLEYLKELRLCDRLIQPPNQALFRVVPRGSRHCRFGTFWLSLDGRSEDDVYGSFRPNVRRDISRALRDGAVIRSGSEEISNFQRLHQATMERKGLPAGSAYELTALSHALGIGNFICAVAYTAEGEPQGGAFVACTREGAYYLYGGSAERLKVPGAIKLVHWALIRECLRRRVKKYDFVGARPRDVAGTSLEHIQSFKARFGTTLNEGYLWKMDIRPDRTLMYEAASGLRNVYRRLRHGRVVYVSDIIDQELRWREDKDRLLHRHHVGTN